jgi:hypothetical protein
LEDPSCEERILREWDSLLPQVLQQWGVNGDHIAAFSDGYRNASLLRDRVRIFFIERNTGCSVTHVKAHAVISVHA